MSVRITDKDNVAMYDSVTGTAFGPIFESPSEIEEFLEWLKEQYMRSKTFKYGNETLLYIEDPRVYLDDELRTVILIWKEERDG